MAVDRPGDDTDQLGGPGSEEVPAFPLGTVLLPGQLMELRVFEPRYRVMLFDLRGDSPAEFLVTMIERGSEVGGGDVRAPVGCMAEVLDSSDTDDEQTLLSILGTDRARVQRWLPEDPYPRALVRRTNDSAPDPDDVPGGSSSAHDLRMRIRSLSGSAERVIELARRLGRPGADRLPDWDRDPGVLTWQVALATPLATLDRYRILAEDDPRSRITLLESMVADTEAMLRTWAESAPHDD